MKNKYAQKRELKRQRSKLLLVVGVPLFVTLLLLTMVVLMMVNKSNYSEVSATVFIEEVSNGRPQEVTLRYIISGEAYFEEIEKVPSKWEDNQLVRIEYLEDDPHIIRKPLNVSPYVWALVLLLVADTIIVVKQYSNIRELFFNHKSSQKNMV